MSLRFDYPDPPIGEEIPVMEAFEQDVLPFVVKHGPEIGEKAMSGDLDAEQIINRHRLLVEGLPHLRPENFKALIAALKRWQDKNTQ